MLGWIYFIASCYIVCTVAKYITAVINMFIKSISRLIFKKGLKENPKKSEEVDNEYVC
jgi:hypothetical protein